MRFLSACLSSLFKSFWTAAESSGISDTPHKVVSSINLPSSHCLLIQIINEDIEQDWMQYCPGLHCYLLASNQILCHLSLGLNIPPVPMHLIVCSSKPTLDHLDSEDLMAESVESLSEIQADNIHYSPIT